MPATTPPHPQLARQLDSDVRCRAAKPDMLLRLALQLHVGT
jgi:hypothetical protein